MKSWLAFDPGANGSLCLLQENGDTFFVDFKTTGLKGYINFISTITPTMTAIEAVSAMPGQGVTSMFSFGQRYGELQGMLITLNIGYDLVRPQAWQKLAHIPPKSGKKGIYEVISRLYPNADLTGLKGGVMDGRCDALGLAHYLRITYN